MQSKKRAKPIKFGRKTEEPKTTANQHPPIEHHVSPVEEHIKPQQEYRVDQQINPPVNQYQSEQPVVPQQHVRSQIQEQHVQEPPRVTHVPQPSQPTHIEHPKPSHEAPPKIEHPEIQNVERPPENVAANQGYAQTPADNSYIEKPAEEINHDVDPSNTEDQQQQVEEATLPTLGGDTYIVEKEVKKSILGYFFLIAIISFIVGLITMAGVSYFLPKSLLPSGISILPVTSTPTPLPQPTSTPVPTVAPVDLSSHDILIFNGSGVTGAATKLKDILTDQGFKVTSVANAGNNDYTDTVLYAAKDVEEEYVAKLSDNLNKYYTVVLDSKKPSVTADDAKVIIIIGSKTSENSSQ